MLGKFEYLQRITVESELEVPDIGQCVIQGRNDLGEEFYIILKTELGYTEQVYIGPICPDIGILPSMVTITYNRYEYNEGKIERSIDKFLNDPKKSITQAAVITIDDVKDSILDTVQKIFPYQDESDEQEYTDNQEF